MYITRLVIENFQSHERTELELSRGLTVLVGESDRGKSAVIRALRWLFENEPRGAGFVRGGASGARVTAVLEDGTAVSRERSSSKNRYIIQKSGSGQEVYERIGTEVPAEVKALHGVVPVKLDDDLYVSLNISPQLEGPFLLSSPGSLKAKAIGRLHSVHVIDAAARDVQQELSSLQREDSRLEEQVQELDRSLEKYADLPGLEKTLQECKRKTGYLEQKQAELTGLSALQGDLARVRVKLEQLRLVQGKLEKLEPGRRGYVSLEGSVDRLHTVLNLRAGYREVREKLQKAEAVLERTARTAGGYGAARGLENRLKLYRDLSYYNEKYRKISAGIAYYKSVRKKTGPAARGKQLHTRLERLYGELGSITGLSGQLAGVRQKANTCRGILQSLESSRDGAGKFASLQDKKDAAGRLKPLGRQLSGLRKERDKAARVLERVRPACSKAEKILILQEDIRWGHDLKFYRGRLRETKERMQYGKEYLAEREKEMEDLALQYTRLLKSLGRCPTCFNALDTGTLEKIISRLTERRGGYIG